MDRNRNYNEEPDWDDREQYPEHRDYPPQRPSEDIWHPNRIDYRNDERERFRGAYRLDNDPRNRQSYTNLNQENYSTEYRQGRSGNLRNGPDRGHYQSDYGGSGNYGASHNAGSMGSYGGAQGYGSSLGGNNAENERWASGHHQAPYKPERQIYGAYRDKNSFAKGEPQSYDGTSRYGSQGADNTRGWRRSEASPPSRYNRFVSEDDARYEIYDTAESQYNRGDYNNASHGSITDNLNLRSHQNASPRDHYGSRQRARFRQGSGYDQDRYSGTSDIGYGQTATPFEYEEYPPNRYYDPLSGYAWR